MWAPLARLKRNCWDDYPRLDIVSWCGRVQIREPIMQQPTPTFRLGAAEWLGLAALAFGSLHILLDFSVGLFPTQGPLSAAVAATFVLTSLILLWWTVSIAAA